MNTPVFLPEKSHGQRSLAGYSPWGGKELDTTEPTNTNLNLARIQRGKMINAKHVRRLSMVEEWV